MIDYRVRYLHETSMNLERTSTRLADSSWGPRCKAWHGRGSNPARGRYRRAGRNSAGARDLWRQPCSRWNRSRFWRSVRATCARTALTSLESRDRKNIQPWTRRYGSTVESHQVALHTTQPPYVTSKSLGEYENFDINATFKPNTYHFLWRVPKLTR